MADHTRADAVVAEQEVNIETQGTVTPAVEKTEEKAGSDEKEKKDVMTKEKEEDAPPPYPSNTKPAYGDRDFEDEDELPEGHFVPTEEELVTLRKVASPLPWSAFLIVVVEFAERYTYYGASLGPFQNYIANPLPAGSTTGAPHDSNVPAGVLGKGQSKATALTTFFSFFCYVTPILGAYIADRWLGRYKTIWVFTVVYLVGLIILVLTSIPSAIESGASFGGIIAAIVIIGFGTGGIKSNVAPLIADQIALRRPVVTVQKGERVLVDPNVTITRVYNIFYWSINVGSAVGTLTTTNAERHVGFWLTFSLPAIIFLLVPFVLAAGRKMYRVLPPSGSIIGSSFRVIRIAFAEGLLRKKRYNSIWDAALPENIVARHDGQAPSWLSWNDTFVAEVRRTMKACKVFCFFPVYWVSYNQMSNNLVSQAANMRLGGTPNDIFSVFDAFAIILAVPFMDMVIYPFLRKNKIKFAPVARIWTGFLFAAGAMIYASVLQYYMYKGNVCRREGLSGTPAFPSPDGSDACPPSDLSVWLQVPSYVLIGISEVFASVTGLEYAYNKAPKSMKSLVQSVYLLTTAVGNAINFALVPVSMDPYLVWNYGGVAIACFVIGTIMWILLRHQDATEEEDNALGR